MRTVKICAIVALFGAILAFVFISGIGLTGKEATYPTISADIDNQPEAKTNKVLLLHSYHKGYPWVDTITRGVQMELEGREVEFEVFYMDTKRKTSEEYKKSIARKVMTIIDEWQPDVVIAADDNAQKYVVVNYIDVPDAPQFVFCGVNSELDVYGYPASNVTGVLERLHFNDSLNLLASIVPTVKNVTFMSCDSPTSRAVLNYIKDIPTDVEVVSFDLPHTFDEWKETVRKAQKSSDAIAIYTCHTIVDGKSEHSIAADEVMKWTIENCDKPIVGFFMFAIDYGALCGYVESGVEQGGKAAKMVTQILDGKKTSDISVLTATKGLSVFNVKTAQDKNMSYSEEMLKEFDIISGKK